MPDLSSFPVTQRWPASHLDRLQFYATPTPLGLGEYANVEAWLRRGLARPAVRRGLHIPTKPA